MPLPLTMNASALPLAQLPRLMTSRTAADRSGVRWLAPASSMTVRPAGAQATAVVVRARLLTLLVAVVNVAALSLASARMVSDVPAVPV